VDKLNLDDLKGSFVRAGRSPAFVPIVLIAIMSALFADQLLRGLSVAMITMEGSSQWNPFWTFARRELMRGHFPLWTPHSLGGWSFPGFPHTACFYPLGFFYYLLPYDRGATYDICMHVVITSLLMYRFLRGLRVSALSAFVGAVIWPTSGLMFFGLHFVPILWTLTWTPLFFDEARRWVAERRSSHLALMTAAGALQILGGSVESFLYELVAMALFAAVFYRGLSRDGRVASFGLVVALGAVALLSSMATLPAFEQASQSVRAHGVSYSYFAERGVRLKAWLSMPVPVEWSNLSKVEGENSILSPAYLGILALVFALYSVISGKGSEFRERKVGLIVLILILLLARNLPILGPILHSIPVMNLFREPVYDMFCPQFLIIALASLGIDRALQKPGLADNPGGEITGQGRSWKLWAPLFIPAAAFSAIIPVTARFMRFPHKQYLLAAFIGLFALGVIAVARFYPRRMKLFMAAGILGVLLLDNWALALSYLPKRPPAYLDVAPDYLRFFSKTEPYERHIVMDKFGPITKDLPQHGGMVINSQTLDGWEGLPNLRFIRFLNLLDDRSIVIEGNRLKKVGYHIVFREGRFIDQTSIPYLNLAGVRYLVARDFYFKFSSPSSLVDAHKLFDSDPQDSLTPGVETISGKSMKTLSLKQGARAEMPFYVTMGDSISFNLCNRGCRARRLVRDGAFDISIRESNDSPPTTVFSRRFEELAACPGERRDIELSHWSGKTVKVIMQVTGQGTGSIVMVEPEVINPQKQFQRSFHASIDVFSNRDAFPRAFLVHSVLKVNGPDNAFEWLKSNPESLRYTAPIEAGKLAPLRPLDAHDIHYLASLENVKIPRYDPDRVRLKFSALATGYVILTDAYYPGWRALVDHSEALISPAYLTFRAVPVSMIGPHTVEFIYRPAAFRIGLWCTFISMFFIAGAFIFNKIR